MFLGAGVGGSNEIETKELEIGCISINRTSINYLNTSTRLVRKGGNHIDSFDSCPSSSES
jgi:hypothetical protein